MNVAGWVWGGVGALVIIGALWLAVSLNPNALQRPTTTADPTALPGITTSMIPEGATTWAPEITNLAARLAADGMKGQTMEGQALHIHQHLDIFVHGQPLPVPALIGINEQANWLSAIHVHDATQIIHVESPFKATYTLGEFFDIWGVRFTKDCLGGYCTDATDTLQVYVNGALYTGDPRQVTLAQHEEIAVVYGTKTEAPATIPASFTFPDGY